MKTFLLIVALLFPLALNAATITSISVTAETQCLEEPACSLPATQWNGAGLSVTAPIDISTGIGLLLNPSIPFYGLHSHLYDSPNIPHNAVVTFGFSEPAVVDSLLVSQHTNGLTRIEGFVGNELSSMNSIGNNFGPDGDVEASGYFSERSNYVFDFNNTTAGLYYQFVITKTSLADGYAAYSLLNPCCRMHKALI
jgi:hypothetical protein